MNKERLLKLAELMDEVASKALPLSLRNWFGNDELKPQEKLALNGRLAFVPRNIEMPYRCGTTACACGYAALTPWFQQQGLQLSEGRGNLTYFDPATGKHHGWDAVKHFFGIPLWQAEALFSEHCYADRGLPTNNPRIVAEEVRAFIEANSNV